MPPALPNKYTFTAGQVHIWLVDTSQVDETLLAVFNRWLSAKERQRNSHYRFAKDRRRDVICRGLLRLLLSNYLGVDANKLRFSKNSYGKPELAFPDSSLYFNLSHSGDFIAFALTLDAQVGVDIECNQRRNNVLEIAERYFSQRELAALFQLPPSQQIQRFFDYWTLKEAYIKARGEGLSLPLNSFSFLLTQSETIDITFDEALNDNPKHWQFARWHPHPDYHLALALRQNKTPLNTRLFTDIADIFVV